MKTLLKIAICDDELWVAEALRVIINNILDEMHCEAKIEIYCSGKVLLENMGDIAILFLDIDMPEMDGIIVGNRVLEMYPACRVIMETGKEERYKEAFRIRALRFVTKPFSINEVREALAAAMEQGLGHRIVEAYAARQKFFLEEWQIVYVKADCGYVEISAGGQMFRMEKGIGKLEEQLDSRMFVRIHRSCILNLFYVTAYDSQKSVAYVRQKAFIIAKRERKAFERSYVEFDLRYRDLVGK